MHLKISCLEKYQKITHSDSTPKRFIMTNVSLPSFEKGGSMKALFLSESRVCLDGVMMEKQKNSHPLNSHRKFAMMLNVLCVV